MEIKRFATNIDVGSYQQITVKLFQYQFCEETQEHKCACKPHVTRQAPPTYLTKASALSCI